MDHYFDKHNICCEFLSFAVTSSFFSLGPLWIGKYLENYCKGSKFSQGKTHLILLWKYSQTYINKQCLGMSKICLLNFKRQVYVIGCGFLIICLL